MRNKRKFKKPIKDDIVKLDDGECSFEGATDSDDQYSDSEKELLKKARIKPSEQNFDSDDEVYGLGAADSDDEEQAEDAQDEEDSMESDVEGLKEDLNLPDERAWGKKKRAYYSTDYVDPDYTTIGEKELAEAELEEQEARNIQKRLAEQLDDADFGLDIIESKEDGDMNENERIVKTDLSRLSKRQKQALMQKESPEFIALVNDFKGRLSECRDILAPFLELIENSTHSKCPAASFVKIKYQVVLNYCVNISFYLMLKAKRLPVSAHPVIKRLAQYRQLISQLEAGQGDLLKNVQEVLKANAEGLPLYSTIDGSKLEESKRTNVPVVSKRKTKGKVNVRKPLLPTRMEDEEIDEGQGDESMPEEHVQGNAQVDAQIDADDNEEDVRDEEMETLEEEKEADDNKIDADGKRAITYQMAKNKGLTPYRKKELRNPRVKHRNKYRKAKIRRKGAVREVRKEVTRYAGEISGIKAGVKKGIKLK